jgi:two-component system, chemotaxis family, sensor kinase CheA
MKKPNPSDQYPTLSTDAIVQPVNAINFGRIEVNSDLVIQKVHDKVCHYLLGEEQLAKKNFAHLLKSKVSEEGYRQLLQVFHTIVTKKNIIDTKNHKNPLDCLKIRILSSHGIALTRYLRCEFKRANNFNANQHWLITLHDISKAVRVSKIIKHNKVKAELKINTLLTLIQFDKDLVEEFFDSTVSSIKELTKILMEGIKTSTELQDKLESIYSIAHQVKGDSAMLNLNSISKKVHDFENHLSALNGKKNISKNDFIFLQRPLKEIIDAIKEVKDLFEKIRDGGWNTENNEGGDSLARQLKHLIKKVAADNKKRVVLVEDGFTDSAIPLKYQRLVSKVLTQLARNSIVHGIEEPRDRLAVNKTVYGCLHVSAHQNKQSFILNVRDDGKGLDFQAIKKSAMASGLFDRAAILNWTQTDTINALFKPGFSTAKTVTQHAGRGIGLDVIKSLVEKCGGKVNVKSIAGQFTEFTLSLPLAASKS